MTKKNIRKSLKHQLSMMSEREVIEKSAAIQMNLINLITPLKENENILIYKSFANEVMVNEIESMLFIENKNIFLPKIKPGNNLVFNRLRSNDQVKHNKYNILESTDKEEISPHLLDLIILPLVGVDNNGYRLGYGGGYYDRGLHNTNKSPNKPLIIGLGYEFQNIDQDFGEPHDIKIDILITENKTLRF